MSETPREELVRRLSAYPKDALPFFQHGFSVASSLTETDRRFVFNEVIGSFKRGTRRIESDEIRLATGLPQRESDQLASVYSLVIGLLSETTASANDFVEAARGILFSPDHEPVALSIAQAICESRAEIKATVDRSQLAGEVLPSLFTFDVAVDLRVRVVSGEVLASVPVAVVHIDTDTDNHELWVQLSAGDIESVIKSLSKALEDMKIAETLAPRKS
jgi:hypothetical protein